MTNEAVPNDERVARTSISRRKMLQRAGVVGAAAWTAPVIIDSLGRAAFAAVPSGCVPYWVKMQPSNSCFNASPASGPGKDCSGGAISFSFPLESGVKCATTCTASCTAAGGKQPVISTVSISGSNHSQVQLPTGCYFSSSLTSQLAGRYDKGNETRFAQTCAGASGTSVNGNYVNNGTQGWVKSSVDFGSGNLNNMPLTYIYIQFCCNS